MTITQRRANLKTVYLSDKWSQKVDQMSDNQVIAIYNRLQGQGKL